jgi:hypothetical protein
VPHLGALYIIVELTGQERWVRGGTSKQGAVLGRVRNRDVRFGVLYRVNLCLGEIWGGLRLWCCVVLGVGCGMFGRDMIVAGTRCGSQIHFICGLLSVGYIRSERDVGVSQMAG